jgi:hypothetical protein
MIFMQHRSNKVFLGLVSLILIGTIGDGGVGDWAIAHTVKTNENVAATFHLEPNHNPKAGELALVWFALTSANGEIIPLADCDCQLVLKQANQPIAPIPLKPLNAEQYKNIPAAELRFPSLGIYTLTLSGKPKSSMAFQPFQLSYDVTVQPGKAAEPEASSQSTPVAPPVSTIDRAIDRAWVLPWLIGGAIGILAIAGLIRHQHQSR